MPTIDILRKKSENFEAALARAHQKLAQGGALESMSSGGALELGRTGAGVSDVADAYSFDETETCSCCRKTVYSLLQLGYSSNYFVVVYTV